MSRVKTSFVTIGMASLLVVLLVLGLLTFSSLTLVSAQNEKQAALRLAERRTAYYEASGKAQEWIRDTLLAGREAGKEDLIFETKVSEETVLHVEIEIDENEENGYRILCYQVINVSDKEAQEALPPLH